ncbi:hypothetical protein Cgig2_016716 [Carnegiea gigantea]|uniref:Uncharacterized protein n=1 Tax=Carnegiea gigantea TaxID=171969 RepID=A0A9Q1KYA5_9CARY|nr:hypothetical protein Cgig2_016716 [Carnegiea gigantea]
MNPVQMMIHPFGPMENSYDLPPFIKYSQKHSSFIKNILSTENLAKQSISPPLPVRFDSHVASSGSEKGPENKKTSPDYGPEPPRWDEVQLLGQVLKQNCRRMSMYRTDLLPNTFQFKGHQIKGMHQENDISKCLAMFMPKLPDFEALTAHNEIFTEKRAIVIKVMQIFAVHSSTKVYNLSYLEQ